MRLLLAAALVCYGAAWLLQLRDFRGRDVRAAGGGARPRSISWAAAAAALHLAALIAFWVVHDRPPLVGFGPACATLGLAVMAGLFVAGTTTERWAAGLLVLPLVMLLAGAAVWAGPAFADLTGFRGPWLSVHIVAVLGGWASLLLASVAALMYLLQFRALKRKEFGKVFRFFPSLESLDRMNRFGLAAGLSVLAVGLLAGWSLTMTFDRGLALNDPDVVFGLLTWAAYAIALGVRGSAGFGPRAAALSVAAFAVSAGALVVFRTLSPATELFL